MPKNAHFWKKAIKSPQRRGVRPQTPVGLLQLEGSGLRHSSCYSCLLYRFFECASSVKRILSLQKITEVINSRHYKQQKCFT